MYKRFFGLKANPFNVNPDPRFLYLTEHARETLACLTYGIQMRKGFILLTGEVGTGKTTLLNKLGEWLRSRGAASTVVFNTCLDSGQFLDFVMTGFGIPCESTLKSQRLLRLYNWLQERYRAGVPVVLIVDEAQNLSAEVLEEIRLLTNMETSTQKLLQIVLSGQPELELKLREARLRQLRQRITLRCRTYPLTPEETQNYVAQRLHLAGANGQPIFSREAIEAIQKYSSGIPRIINLICEHALIGAFVDQQRLVAASVIDDVAREFDLDGETQPLQRPAAGQGENLALMTAIQKLLVVADRLDNSENKVKKGSYEPHS